ncbi:hypothetical protein, partial [Xanthomonas phaseoli]|uniref:hypothetical protein n=1 Tax=Xanthomonas phaseoli TaxID=1985254 RepID=UPI000528241C
MGEDVAPPPFLTEAVVGDVETAGAFFGAAFLGAVLPTDAFFDARGLTVCAARAGRTTAPALA